MKKKALLGLLVLAPVLGEIVTGSSPPLHFFRPIYFLFLLGMYGGGVLLIREMVRSRGLGWINIAILGAAYGLIEEGLIITSFYNPAWGGVKPLAGVGWFLGVNWIWALYSVFVHIALTVFSSIVLTESLFPQLAERSWLNSEQRLICIGWFLVTSVFGFNLFVNTLYPNYSPSLFSYLLTIGLTILLVFIGLKLKIQSFLDKESLTSCKIPYFTIGFTVMALSIIVPYALTKINIPSLVILLMMLTTIFAGGFSIVSLTKKHDGWTAKDRLALASGVITPWLIRMVLLEFGFMTGVRKMNMAGLTIAAILLVGLLWKGGQTLTRKKKL